jgi:outer membrane protein
MRQSNLPTLARLAVCALILLPAASTTNAQTRIGYISMTELIQAMPEFKKADSSLTNYENALDQHYKEMESELQEKEKTLSGPDTATMNREVLDVRKKAAADLYAEMQRFYQQINPLIQQKQDELLAPIRKKANDLIWELAKEHGYTYVLLKETIAVYPLTDDLMPYAKQKLRLK